MQNNPVLKVDGLSYTYIDGTQALNAVTFEVMSGQSIGIVGGNGAGKSTLLLLLSGLLEPDRGVVAIQGEPMNKKSFKQLCNKIGFVFQNAEDQLFNNSVFEDVAYAPKHAGMAAMTIEQMVNQTLDAVRIPHLAKRAPHKLSGGEQRLAALASALVMSPELLILDEPTSGLDPQARRNLIQLLNQFAHTKLITSHDMDFIWEVCDHVLLMHGGELIAFGEAKTILSDQILLEQCQLERPLRLQGCPKCGI